MKSLFALFLTLSLMGCIGMAQQKSTEHTLKLGEGGRSVPASIGWFAWATNRPSSAGSQLQD